MYAIIETGGKQYKVSPGQTIEVERLDAGEGASVEMDKVLCIADGEKITLGTPLVEDAKVIATAKGVVKDDKVVVLRFKSKVRHSVKTGHRQLHTMLVIDRIVGPGLAQEEPETKPRRRRKGVTKDGA